MRAGNRVLVLVLVVLVLIVLLLPTLGYGMMGGGMMGPGMFGPGMMGRFGPRPDAPAGPGWAWGLAMGLGMLAMLAFWAAIIVGVVLLVRWLTAATAAHDQPETPLEILRRRYAAGEITHEEFERMRQALER